MSQSLFKLLYKKYNEELELDVLANPLMEDIIYRMPEVSCVIKSPFLSGKLNLLSRIKLGITLRKNHYDQVFVLTNSLKSAITPFFAKIKKRTGFIGEQRYILLNDLYKLDKENLPLMIERFSALATSGKKPENIEYPQLNIDIANQELLIRKFKIDKNVPIIAFCPAAEYGPSKRWPPEHFAKLANMLTENNCQILILGSKKDIKISQSIIELIAKKSYIIDVCGKTTLTEALDLLAIASFIITNDSGLMHMGASIGSNIIAIFGSTAPTMTPPLTKNAQIFSVNLECSPCFKRVCKFGHYNCLNLITAEEVFNYISTWKPN